MNLKWSHTLASTPLCVPPETCSDQYMVNAVAVSDSGKRAVGAAYYQNYDGTTRTRVDGKFGTFCYDSAGTLLFKDEFLGDKGIYAVAMSGDGKTAAGGGLFTMGKQNPTIRDASTCSPSPAARYNRPRSGSPRSRNRRCPIHRKSR